MITKRVITSMDKIPAEVLKVVMKKYPDGWSNHVRRINKPNGDFFYGITVEMGETAYLIKVNVKVDSKSELEKEEEQQERLEELQEQEQQEMAAEPSEDPDF
jgi:hypothetical protein